MNSPVYQSGEAARHASHVLASQSPETLNGVLLTLAELLEANGPAILEANQQDVDLAQSLVKSGELSTATLNRLRLSPQKLAEMVASVRAIVHLPEVLGKVLDRMVLDTGLELEKISVPLGVLAVIFEARPDAVTQISALAIKSGNAAILKPGKEVERTASILVGLIRQALRASNLPEDAISLVLGREAVTELLKLSQFVDLVIPRGSKSLVEYVQSATRIPVLGHAEGICHIYVDDAADLGLALNVVDDAKTDYPSACNTVETVLVHRDIALSFLPQLYQRLSAKGVRILGCAETQAILSTTAIEPPSQWNTEYGDLIVAVRVVDDLQAAVEHIHRYGSNHTESILTENREHAEQFLRDVDAAGVYHNVSTRFADGFRYGFGAEVGVSTSKLHARGPVGLDGLTTYKYLLRGTGQVVSDYHGANARPFIHQRLKT